MFLKQINCGKQYEVANSDGDVSDTKAVIRAAPGATFVTLNGWSHLSQAQFSSEERRCGGMETMNEVILTDAQVVKWESAAD